MSSKIATGKLPCVANLYIRQAARYYMYWKKYQDQEMNEMAISVKVRFSCREVTGDARNGEYQLPDNCTVAEFMKLAAEENGTFVDNYMDYVLFVVSGKNANADTVLKDSDDIRVLGMVYGG